MKPAPPLEAEQAECVVRALDRYIGLMNDQNSTLGQREAARAFLVRTLAATIAMSEPRKSALQK